MVQHEKDYCADDGNQKDRSFSEAQRQPVDEVRTGARGDRLSKEHRGGWLQTAGRFAVGWGRFLIYFTRHQDTFADVST